MDSGKLKIFIHLLTIFYNVDLIKRLIPQEFNEYLIRNGVRQDSRKTDQFRDIEVKRNVISNIK